MAICLGTFVGSILVTKATIGLLKTIINNKVPITLKHRCIIAALLAFLLAPIVDSNDVTHVPILSPYKTGRAAVIGNSPCEARTIRIPIEALELWIVPVIRKPAKMPRTGFLLRYSIASCTCDISDTGAAASFIKFIPTNRIPKPISISLMFFMFFFLVKNQNTIPIPIAIGAYFSMLKDTNWAVTVVPIFAPIITPTACCNDIIPAFTKPIVMTVVALELCIIAVTKVPTRTPIILLVVNISIIFFSFSPAAFCKPSPITFIP